MKFTKEQLLRLCKEVIDEIKVTDDEWSELSEKDFDKEFVSQLSAALDEALVAALDPFLHASYDVRCEMPKNEHDVNRRRAKKCTKSTCDKYFCKNHRISKCTFCGSTLA